MLSKFFPKRPQKGQPLSLRGLFPGLAKMDHAWATLSCFGGQISWDHGRPTIIPPGSGAGDKQLDHAFLPTQTGPTEATLTAGYVTTRDGTRLSITTATTVGAAWGGGEIDFTSDKCWWVQIKYDSTVGSTLGDFDELRWESGASFPDHRAGAGAALGYTINIPVVEFPSNTWASMIRRQTNDIIDSPHDEVRGTPALFKVIALRAYWTEADPEADPQHDADELVPPETEFVDATMYLHNTYDWVRAHGGI